MSDDHVVLRADQPQRDELEKAGWTVIARSFGARLDRADIDRHRLSTMVERVAGVATIRELTADDIPSILVLDSATSTDYPGSIATRHERLDHECATPTAARRAFGALSFAGELIGLTMVDLDGDTAETDFTVVHREWRRRGIAVALKAASLLALDAAGVRGFRTGGSADNAAIIAANAALGYVRDEEWLTLAPPTP
ncbi:acetyltransferase [Leifsonia aquatica]|uniref:acetyltransferase n=1 Tax=Leifsonia aquatica TaxID=144185 RepID=UPI00384C21F4